ncbi:hypothetical protein Sme01_06920 [Sphaerisporangium melleum]|uniref:Uncharacterized protein n=1 Tax=Sphaerisporangium melleum TaxID=321316 RepID=A0A917QWU1_9ACTN|nr:FxLYD domain-containing protein [Sphaerisporangium melleum]GGK73420.1 hypothetical protein GCM10007964_15280 [Sphaerisporangium melleum]GII68216.1 hypothetical protein Sme01_06920 [Sphaerisporangium melleum]
MIKGLTGTFLAVTAAAGFIALAPTAASASTAGQSAPASVTTTQKQLIDYKISFGTCKRTCHVKVRIKNISRKQLYSVNLTVRLYVNGTKVGTCTDYVGSIRPRGVRSAGCTVRTAKLAGMWNRYDDGEINFNTRAKTRVNYRYYA